MAVDTQEPAVRITATTDLPGRHSVAWNAAPLTKFRTPRVRRDVIARPALLQRLIEASASVPVTLVCAPGGSGKTSLLSQLAAHLATLPASDTTLQWVALDEDDNDRHRFFAALLRAAEPLDLAWETPPGT